MRIYLPIFNLIPKCEPSTQAGRCLWQCLQSEVAKPTVTAELALTPKNNYGKEYFRLYDTDDEIPVKSYAGC
jgi:hypothetical protein